MSDEDFESEEEVTLLRKALDVELPDNFNPHQVPKDGFEYLQQVMYEAKHSEQIVVADMKKMKIRNEVCPVIINDSCIKSPFAPSIEWQNHQIEDFTLFRQFHLSISNKPCIKEMDDVTDWRAILTTVPNHSTISTLTQTAKVQLIEIINDELNKLPKGTPLQYEINVWIYALLAGLDFPLCPDSCYVLRMLCRTISNIRANLPQDSRPEDYTNLNLYICLISRFFRQLDLAD